LIAGEHSANKSVTLPIIGALLTLRDKNLGSTMTALASLDLKTIEIIKRLAHFYAPDLEENIQEYVVAYHLEDPSPTELIERKKKLLVSGQYHHAFPQEEKYSKMSPEKQFEEEKVKQIPQKLGDSGIFSKEEEEDTLSFLLIE